ncbi:MAG: VPLPA-CTERM-specific exosortase XrtD [Hyphomicrobiales bacterium]|nr:VPLPA-CTERM-specific exosortase XrtD [Hyphomicrobiales bacterium]
MAYTPLGRNIAMPMLRYYLLAGAIIVCFFTFHEGLMSLVERWIKYDEYSHGFFIPIISSWLIWNRRSEITQFIGRPNWIGLVLVLGSLGMLIVGNLSAIFILAQVGFVIALSGIVVTFGGFSFLRFCSVPLFFLLFAIPLPFFVDAALSWRLQLISSELGVAIIGLFNIPVFLEGNVIDLGEFQLMVVEACSGLRYLFPLLSLGFLIAYAFKAPLWQRMLLFLSTIPITIVMNSARIGMIGILVNYWGIGMAEGFLHAFEGWIIFIACGGILMAEIYLMSKYLLKVNFYEAIGFPEHTAPKIRNTDEGIAHNNKPIFISLTVLAVAFGAIFMISDREEVVPQRQRFVTFPKIIGEWSGNTSFLKPRIELFLGLDDYILSNYRADNQPQINLYIAYYKSQRNGVSPHSPQACIPGGGWLITELAEKSYSPKGIAKPIKYNRAVISRGDVKQIVYYWFDQRGRTIANEYMAKVYLLKDAILLNRTDGTLIRLVTNVSQNEEEEDADNRLKKFMSDLSPITKKYIPGLDDNI